MSEYTFKNLNEIDNVSEPADGTTVMGFENGTPIQMPMNAIKGSGGVFVINSSDSEYSTADVTYGDKIKEALLSGKAVWLFLNDTYYTPILAFDVSYRTNGVLKLTIYPALNPSTTGIESNSTLNKKLQFSITG